MNRAKLKSDLVADEGYRLDAYKDTQGYWTIGIGHLLGREMRMSKITDSECSALFNADVVAAEALARVCVTRFVTLDDVRQRALVNMAFNRGRHMRSSATITPAINGAAAGDHGWEQVTAAIAASPWAKQVGQRASRLAYMLEHGRDPA